MYFSHNIFEPGYSVFSCGMEVKSKPQAFVDESDDRPIREIEPVGSRFDAIAIKRLKDSIEVRARKHGTDNIIEFQAETIDQLYRGVSIQGDVSRRDLDDDLEDALQLLGYTAVDRDTRSY